MDEEPLQQAILEAINSAASSKESLTARVTDALVAEMSTLPGSGKTLGEIQQRLETLDRELTACSAGRRMRKKTQPASKRCPMK